MKVITEYTPEEIKDFLQDYFIEARMVDPYDDFYIEFVVSEKVTGPKEHSQGWSLSAVRVINEGKLP